MPTTPPGPNRCSPKPRHEPPSARRLLVAAVMLSCTVILPRAAWTTEVPFAGWLADTGGDPLFISAVDLDHDGDLDLLVAWFQGDAIGWLENTAGDGTAWTEHVVFSNADGAASVAAADLDDDGDLDLVSASAADDSVRWHENLGGSPPSFDPTPEVLTSSADYARSVAAGDLDSDGDVDVVSCSSNDNEVAWYENDGASHPTFSKHILLHAPPAVAPDLADNPMRIIVADITGDGAPDIAWASSDDDRVGMLVNAGGSPLGFTPRIVSSALQNGPRQVSADDVDGDGDMDLLATGCFDDSVRWYRNEDGAGISWSPHQITSTADYAWAVSTADVDADGDVDVLVSSHNDDVLAWHENTDGVGTAWTEHVITASSGWVYQIAFADLDGDGDGDVATADYHGDHVYWYRNDTIHRSALFNDRHLISAFSSSGPNDIEVGDVDRDGDPDLVASSFWDRTVRWYDNDLAGSGSFVSRALYTAATNRYTEAVTLADLDQDGDLDAVSAYNDLLPGTTYDAIYWHESDGGAPPSFTARTVTTVADGPVSLDTGDLDSDGDLDVVSGSMDDDTLRWYRSSGASPPTFSAITMYDNVYDPMTLWAEDLHHHGEIDILTATRGQDIVFWLWNDSAPTPSFWAYDATYVADGPRAVCAADIDRDGSLDAVVAGENNDGVWWLSNNFTSMWSAYPITNTLGGAGAVAVDDLDGDGDLDIVAAGHDADEIVWFDNGATTPWDWTERTISTAHNGPRSVAISDLDGDGDLDVAAVSFADNEVAWFENRGGQAAISTVPTGPGGGEPGDLVDVFRFTVTHRGRIGDSPVELSKLGLRIEIAPGVLMPAPLVGNLFDAISLHEDADGSGTFDPASEPRFYWVVPTSTTNGELWLSMSDGASQLAVDHGDPRTYFVVFQLSPGSASQGVPEFRVTHRLDTANGPGVSQVEDRSHDILLDLEPAPDVSSDWVQLWLFADGFESGDTSAWSAGG